MKVFLIYFTMHEKQTSVFFNFINDITFKSRPLVAGKEITVAQVFICFFLQQGQILTFLFSK